MATRLEDEFDPTRIIAPNAAYPAGSLKDETTPGVSDDGTPLASRVGNDWQGFSQSVLDKAGIAANGQPDSVTNPQILQGIETLDNNRQKETTGLSDITEVSAGDDLFPLIGQGIRVAGIGLWVVPDIMADGSPLPNPAILDSTPLEQYVTVNGGSEVILLLQEVVKSYNKSTFNVVHYGAKVNDLTFDSYNAINNCIQSWVASLANGEAALLEFPAGEYRSDGDFDIQLPNPVEAGATVNAYGAKVFAYGNNGVPFFNFKSNGTVRGVVVNNLIVDLSNSPNSTEGILMDGGSDSAVPREFLFNCSLNGCRVEKATNDGIVWANNVFECNENDCHVILQTTTSGYGKRVRNIDGNPSSLEYRAGSTRGGINGLFLGNGHGDTKVYGGTYIESGEHAIFADSCNGALLSGCHTENAWENGVIGSAAGIKFNGNGAVKNCLGTSIRNQRTVVDVFADPNRVRVEQLRSGGNLTSELYLSPNTGDVSTDTKRSLIVSNSLANERRLSVDTDNRVTAVSNQSSYSHNRDDSRIIEVLLDQNLSFDNSTNQIAGDELVVRMTQDGTGGHNVTWGSEYVRSQNVDLSPNARTNFTFYWTGGAWVEQSVTVI